jgi:hypothetical protein
MNDQIELLAAIESATHRPERLAELRNQVQADPDLSEHERIRALGRIEQYLSDLERRGPDSSRR